jgi:hypothetical protein
VDRLIDPSFDDPSRHIRFDPASRQFESLTQMGKLMKERIFSRSRRFDERLKKLSDEMKYAVENDPQPEQTRDRFIKVGGYSFFVQEFYKYWSEMKEKHSDSEKAQKNMNTNA